jgi:hypothetical protein
VVQRILPGNGGRPSPVLADLRGFVPSRASSVVSRWASEQIDRAVAAEPALAASLRSHKEHSWFDARAHLLADAVFREIPYELRGGTAWQLPEETLARGTGDCEDRATLLASSLVAAGISPYNVRVALGTVVVKSKASRNTRAAHAWVVYRAEDGQWLSLEPVPSESATRAVNHEFEYRPDYVFNGDHQWAVRPLDDTPAMKKRWNQLDPTFHGDVHRSIVLRAADLAKVPASLRSRLARTFTTLFGQVIDNPDIRFRSYDPRDHFDSALIDESWRYVKSRLGRFYKASLTDSEGVNNLCWALHAIADFYAHSTYVHFLARERKHRVPYDPIKKQPALKYDYAGDPVFSKAKLSYYKPWYKPADFDRYARWAGGPISGRYSLKNDSKGTIESLTNEAPSSAFNSKTKAIAGSLPHHDEIAVDEFHGSNKLYSSAQFNEQYTLRYELAVQHIVKALKAHPKL